MLQGIKLELFIFDTFPMASKVTLMEVIATPRLDLVNVQVERNGFQLAIEGNLNQLHVHMNCRSCCSISASIVHAYPA